MVTVYSSPVNSLSFAAMASPPTVNCSAVADGARAIMMGFSTEPRGLGASVATTGASVTTGAAVGALVGAAVGVVHAANTIMLTTNTENSTNKLFFTFLL